MWPFQSLFLREKYLHFILHKWTNLACDFEEYIQSSFVAGAIRSTCRFSSNCMNARRRTSHVWKQLEKKSTSKGSQVETLLFNKK